MESIVSMLMRFQPALFLSGGELRFAGNGVTTGFIELVLLLPHAVSMPTSSLLIPSARVGVIAGVPAKSERRFRRVGQRLSSAALCLGSAISLAPNKALEPTRTGVTPRAGARVAPPARVAHL
jgi:hypothetical protein